MDLGGTMKSITFCLALLLASTAQAGLIVGTTSTDITAYGFGTSPPILTLQADTLERGCVAPTDNVGGYSTSGCGLVGLGLVAGSNKYATPTLTSLGVTAFSNLALLFNVNEPGSSQQVTLQTLTLTLYNGAAPTGQSFSLEAPVSLTNITQGQGGAGFVITIDPPQYGGMTFNGNYRVGLAATVGCLPAAACDGALNFATGDGPESFTIVRLGTEQPIPEPATAALIGGGLIALAWTLRRRKAS